jgi:hypothetical protein
MKAINQQPGKRDKLFINCPNALKILTVRCCRAGQVWR